MNSLYEKRLYAVVDVGDFRTKVVAFIVDAGVPKIVGFGSTPTQGLSKGQVVDIDKVSKSIENSVSQAELMVGAKINEFVSGISTNHLSFVNNNATITIYSKEVLQSDKDRVMEAAQRILLQNSDKILHAIPQMFIINKDKIVSNPVGMTGAVRLDAHVHLVVANGDGLSNLTRCFEKCGIKIKKIVANSIGSAHGLMKNENERSILILNIGSDITDIIICSKGAIIYSGHIIGGGSDITREISSQLSIPLEDAEEIKNRYGCAYTEAESQASSHLQHNISYKLGERELKLSRATLSDVIRRSYTNLFNKINKELSKDAFHEKLEVPIEIYLTGGASKMEGLESLAIENFKMPVSIKNPISVDSSGLSDIVDIPDNTTAIGIMYSYIPQLSPEKNDIIKTNNLLPKIWHWLKENF